MTGHCILSHGLHSSPNANKVSALARVAQSLGWSHERPDYSDIDAVADVRDVPSRIARLRLGDCGTGGQSDHRTTQD